MALTFAGSTWTWNDGRTIATFAVSGVLLATLLLQQYFVLFTSLEGRMFPPGYILGDWTLVLLNIVTAAGSVNIFIPVYFIPIYFIFVDGDSALMAAVRLLPYITFLAFMNIASGALLPKIGWATFFAGGVFTTIGAATMFTVSVGTAKANIYGYSLLLGAGAGLTFQRAYTVGSVRIMMKTGSGLDVQRVISMLNLSQLGFSLVSLLIGGQIFQSVAKRNLTYVLHGLGFSQAEIGSAIAGTQSTLFASLSPVLKEQATVAITDAISRVYIVSMSAGAIVVVSALLMQKEKLFAPTASPTDGA
ncbi:hypothetical protein LTR22_023776 [Elasticomyces elasticus]|nr:hypothetical protein LTR22_023776 [Elasticomyces elasticus]KAK5745830.1 hypothetical protein LTS12_022982 [Elasticomyces elasticus]